MIGFRSARRCERGTAGAPRGAETAVVPRRGGVRVWLVLAGFALAWCLAGIATEQPSLASLGPSAQDIAFATKDGLLTATFPDTTDDAALNAAIPVLVAKGVQAVSLRGAPVRNIGPVADLASLRTLDICGTQVRDVAGLAALTSLRSLNLQFLPINDLRPLAHLTNLRFLNIGGTDVHDLTPLAGLANLRDLVIAVTKVADVSPLASLNQLTSLDLGNTWVSNVRPLSGMANLRDLKLNGTLVVDVQPLSAVTNLRESRSRRDRCQRHETARSAVRTARPQHRRHAGVRHPAARHARRHAVPGAGRFARERHFAAGEPARTGDPQVTGAVPPSDPRAAPDVPSVALASACRSAFIEGPPPGPGWSRPRLCAVWRPWLSGASIHAARASEPDPATVGFRPDVERSGQPRDSGNRDRCVRGVARPRARKYRGARRDPFHRRWPGVPGAAAGAGATPIRTSPPRRPAHAILSHLFPARRAALDAALAGLPGA